MTALEFNARRNNPMPCRYLVPSLAYARIHSWSKIGQRIKICSGKSLGQAEAYQPVADSKIAGIAVKKSTLSTGWKFLFMGNGLKEKRGSDLGENVVLLDSTGEYEIWTGFSTRKIGLCTP